MSTNIIRWHNTICDWTIPLSLLYNDDETWTVQLHPKAAVRVTATDVETGYLVGICHNLDAADPILEVGAMDWTGVGSGIDYEYLLELLRESKGHLVATLTWESGEREELEVHDGAIARSYS